MATSAPGWYADPANSSQLRYFDGFTWSNLTVPSADTNAASAIAAVPTGPPNAAVARLVGRAKIALIVVTLGFPLVVATLFLAATLHSGQPNLFAVGFCLLVITLIGISLARILLLVRRYRAFTQALLAPQVPDRWNLAARGEVSSLNADAFLVFRTTGSAEQTKQELSSALGRQLAWQPGKLPAQGGPDTPLADFVANEWIAHDKHVVYTITRQPFTPAGPTTPVVAASKPGELLIVMDSDLKAR